MQSQILDTRSGPATNTGTFHWHLITCEFPPQIGGVADYTGALASGLADRGDEVHVWCPGTPGGPSPAAGVTVHRELGAITRSDLSRVDQLLDGFPKPRRIVVQWVPHGYGYHSMNLGFCWWVWKRAVFHGDTMEIMLHEPFLPFGRNWRQIAVAFVHRLMTMLLLRGATRVWMSIPEWEKRWRPYALGRRISFEWLPIPSAIAVVDNPDAVEAIRRQYVSSGAPLLAHFGTYGWPITSLLEPILLALNDGSGERTVLLIGNNSEQFREALVRKEPRLARMVRATGALSAEDLSCHVAACDLMIQPYPDGVSTRRTSFMVGLSHGKPIVT